MQEQNDIRNDHLRQGSTSDDPDQVRMHRRMQEEAQGHDQDEGHDNQQQMGSPDIDSNTSRQSNSSGNADSQQSR